MSTTTASSATAPPSGNLFTRFFGIVTAPRATFEGVVAHPRWFGMLALTTLITIFCTSAPMFTDWGEQAALDVAVGQMEAMGRTIDDATYEGMRRGMRIQRYIQPAAILIFAPIMLLIFSGIAYAVFNAGMGGNATFKQVVSVLAHAGAISALAQLFALPLNFARQSMSSTTNLAVLLPMLEEHSFAAYLLGTIDLFMVWYVVVLAIGLAVLYRRRTQPITIGLFVVYAVIAVCIAVIRSSFGGAN